LVFFLVWLIRFIGRKILGGYGFLLKRSAKYNRQGFVVQILGIGLVLLAFGK
jgi:hypothetical protein